MRKNTGKGSLDRAAGPNLVRSEIAKFSRPQTEANAAQRLRQSELALAINIFQPRG